MYKNMIEQARKDGVVNEKAMNASVESIDQLLAQLKDVHPDVYSAFIAKQHEIMYGPHYNELFATIAVAGIEYTDADGKSHKGEYWSIAEIEEATRGLTFPQGTTKYDKYVAYNVMKSDLCKGNDDKAILNDAYNFFFADEDYRGQGKIWRYMQCIKGQKTGNTF